MIADLPRLIVSRLGLGQEDGVLGVFPCGVFGGTRRPGGGEIGEVTLTNLQNKYPPQWIFTAKFTETDIIGTCRSRISKSINKNRG